MPTLQLYKPHKKQLEIHKSIESKDATYYILNIGRQFGKTILLENQALKWGIENENINIGWVSPIYKQASKSYQSIFGACVDTPVLKKYNESKLTLEFVTGSKITFFSAESEDGLRGNTFDYLICDEFAFIKPSTWQMILRPTVLVRGKKVVLASTPKGKNLFYDLYNTAKDNTRYISFTGTSFDNPYANPEELEDIKKTLPDAVWRQEYMAEFVDSASVFKNIHDVIGKGKETENTYIGIDIGFQNDYTVLTALNNNREVIDIERFTNVTASEVKKRINSFIRSFENPEALIELNNQGLPIYQDLVEDYDLYQELQGFNTTNKSKGEIINNLVKCFNEKDITIPNNEDLILELESFIYKNTATGLIKFEAASGYHDDMVMSLAIANKCLNDNKDSYYGGYEVG